MIAINLSGRLNHFGADLARMREVGIPFAMRRERHWIGSRRVIREYGVLWDQHKYDGIATIYVRLRDVELVQYIVHTKATVPDLHSLRFDLVS